MSAPVPVISVTSPAGFYPLGGQTYGKGDFFAGDELPAFSAVIWDVANNVLIPSPLTLTESINLATLAPRDGHAPMYFDGVNMAAAYITPGSTSVPPLQCQVNATTYSGAYTDNGYTAISFVGYADSHSVLISATNAGAAIVTKLDLNTQSITGDVIYSKAGATDYYLDYDGNYWYKLGGAWASDTNADPYLAGIFNQYFGATYETYYSVYMVVGQGYIVVGATASTDTEYHLFQNGTQTDFTPYNGPIGGTPFYQNGSMGAFSDLGFFNTPMAFDGANYSTLYSAIVTYGIGGGEGPPPDPGQIPPTPVPPYVPPNPGRVIPPLNIQMYSTTNISHETTGNY